MKRLIIYCVLLACLVGCKNQTKQPELTNKDIANVLDQMTRNMIQDVTNPPLAARFYSYACISGYTVLALNDKNITPLKSLLNGFPDIKAPIDSGEYSTQLSAILAMSGTAKKMQPSGRKFNDFEKRFLDSCRKIGFSDEVIDRSRSYANQVIKQVMPYVKADRYNRISNYPRYTPLGKEGTWYPTPPAFFPPVEPYFKTVRPFLLDSCSQFKPVPPTTYSTDKKSDFFKLLMGNYSVGSISLTQEQRNIAGFWDCNPFAIKNKGHLLVGMKKISPGAHWLGITGIACKEAKLSFAKSLEIYSMVSMGLMDSFAACWDEKYRSNRIRPETAIRKLIDPSWKPLLQTPPFPEYPSGHSTISATSAAILTYYFGPDHKYKDTVEVSYGLAPRSFTSFKQAAAEAAISRYYGGIHFMDANNNGAIMGYKIGDFVVGKLKRNNIKPAL